MTERERLFSKAWPRVLRWWLVSRLGLQALHRLPGFTTPMFLEPRFRHVGSLAIYTLGTEYEPALAFLPRLIAPGDVVLDCGANQGAYAIAAASLTGPQGVVVAIEPQAYATRAIRISAAAGDLRNVRCIQAVVTEADGEEVFYGGGAAVSASLYRTDLPETSRVRSVAIDSVLEQENLSRADLIKLDVEGAELRALQGARGALERWRPYVIFEVWDPEEPKSIAAAGFLRALGYELYDVLPGDRLRPVREGLIRSFNLLAVPVEKRAGLAPLAT